MAGSSGDLCKGPTGGTADCVNSRGQLPVVDPDYLVIERRSEKLHAYACGLFWHLRRIRAGERAQGYPITTIMSAAIWLTESYAAAGVPPAPELAQLLKAIVKPHPNASTLPVRRSSAEAYWAAVQFEAAHAPDPSGKEPSTATLYGVAKHVRARLQNRYASQKTAEGTVRGWRRLPHYRDNVALQRPSALRVKT